MILRISSTWEQRLQQQACWPGHLHLEYTFPMLYDLQHAPLKYCSGLDAEIETASAAGPSPAAGHITGSLDSADDASPAAAPESDLGGIYEGVEPGITCCLHHQPSSRPAPLS